jgi:uncharacterized protein YjbI with pentapeptide repeats
MNELKYEVWEHLVGGKEIQRLDLPMYRGRIDLRGLVLQEPSTERTIKATAGQFEIVSGLTVLRGIRWENIDFSGSNLQSLRFHDCSVRNCVFDDCSCRDWRMWRSEFVECTFRRSDLRESALGAVDNGKRNVFTRVDFTEADLRKTAYTSAEFSGCTFKETNLKGVDFQGSVFSDCRFEGELDGVLFYDLGFNGKSLSPNEMLRTDFSHARFRFVEFRRLNLATVRLPENDDHLVFEDFPRALEVLLAALKGKHDLQSRKLAAILGNMKKWLGPKQRRGVLSKRDILNTGGPQALERVLELVRGVK